MNKKKMLAFLLALGMLASLFAGCSKDNSDKSSGDAGEKKEKDTLVILDTQVVEAFDPLNTALNYKLEWHQLFDVLIEFQEDGSMGPALAESYELADDGKGYIFHLRDDVDFTDGTHFE